MLGLKDYIPEDNEVMVFGRDGGSVVFERQPKRLLAAALLDMFAEALRRR